MHVSTPPLLSSDAPKRASDLITDACEPPRGCWDLNSGPLEEQLVLLTAEPSLQPRILFLFYFILCVCVQGLLFFFGQDRISPYSPSLCLNLKSSYLSLQNAGIKGTHHHHAWLNFVL